MLAFGFKETDEMMVAENPMTIRGAAVIQLDDKSGHA